jgi:NADH dehydrogenase
MERDFRAIDPRTARVILVEAAPGVLPPYPEPLQAKAKAQLERLGVEVRTRTRVTQIDARGISLGDERIPARTVLWAAGVQASPLARSLGVPLDAAGRVLVTPRLTIPGRDDLFVIGDLAALEQDGRRVPGVSPAAIQMGRHAALGIRRALRGEPLTPFRYVDKGSFATIGRGAAVGDIYGKLQLSGFPAWIAWLGIHILFLIGFRNRFLVLFQWAYSYLTYRRGARLITDVSCERRDSPLR